MTTEDKTAASEPQQEFSIHNIYLKDSSFESPNSPEVFQTNPKPAIQLTLAVNHTELQESVYEVVLSVTVTAKEEEATTFLVEIQQAGIFTLKGFDAAGVSSMLGIYIPNILFPYARETVSNMVTRGGFPPLLLEPVNFEALYAQNQQPAAGSESTH